MKQLPNIARGDGPQAQNRPPVYGTALYPEPLQIELITTLDDAICEMPPLDAGVWHVVRSGGPTLWRRIYLE